MCTLKTKKILAEDVKAIQVPELFRKNDIPYFDVCQVNWPKEFPYCPKMKAAIACTDSAILVHYKVQEQSVRAVAQKDHDAVWEDSCAEFFSSPAEDGLYYNVECNCAGKLLIAVGPDRNQRTPAPKEVMEAVDRWASLGTEPFDTKEEATEWEIALVIPFTTYFKHHIESLEGKTLRANFYKCGDKLPVAHFLSWKPIGTPTPDFHQPTFFGEVEF